MTDTSPASATGSILRLPDELLSDICIQVLQSTYETFEQQNHSYDNTDTISFYAWLVVAHVCQRWRRVALRTPRLWAMIELASIDCLATMLSRAGSVPLHVFPGKAWQSCVDAVTAPGEAHPALPLAELLWRNMHRVESLTLNLSQSLCDALSTLTTASALGAPRLRSLRLVCTPSMRRAAPLPLLSSSPLPSLTYFSWCARALELASVQDYVRPALTHLEVSLTSIIAVPTWLDTLKGLPHLIELFLYDSVQPETTPQVLAFRSPPPSHVVRLASLAHMVLCARNTASFLAQLSLLASIEPPRACATELKSATALARPELAYMWAVLATQTRRLADPDTPLECTISCDEARTAPHHERLSVSFAAQVLPDTPDDGRGYVLLMTAYSSLHTVLRALARSPVPLAHVALLSLHGARRDFRQKVLSAAALRPLLRTVPNLHTLSVGAVCDPLVVLRALEAVLDCNADARGVLPVLRTVAFLAAAPCPHYDPASEPIASPLPLIRVLRKWAAQTPAGAPLALLMLSTSLMPRRGDVAALEASGAVRTVMRDDFPIEVCVACGARSGGA